MSPTFKKLKADCENEAKKEAMKEQAEAIKAPLERYMLVIDESRQKMTELGNMGAVKFMVLRTGIQKDLLN
eukprot:6779372-Pyramimonas_sp.AAC.1